MPRRKGDVRHEENLKLSHSKGSGTRTKEQFWATREQTAEGGYPRHLAWALEIQLARDEVVIGYT